MPPVGDQYSLAVGQWFYLLIYYSGLEKHPQKHYFLKIKLTVKSCTQESSAEHRKDFAESTDIKSKTPVDLPLAI